MRIAARRHKRGQRRKMQKLMDRDTAMNKQSMAKQAVALAMRNRWDDAVGVNRAILEDFPDDLEASNRLGKALSELGRNREAKEAFQRALEVSPHNGIARKNLERLMSLGDDQAPRPLGAVKTAPKAFPRVFIEGNGKATTTALMNLAPPQSLLKLAPGHPVNLHVTESSRLKVTDLDGRYIGSLDPKIAARLERLARGGNRYEATVTGVGFQELTIIIRETYTHPSQAGAASFPSRLGAGYHAYMDGAPLDDDDDPDVATGLGGRVIKDWSDDDTEPGDDEAFSPVLHRIINRANGEMPEDDY